MIPMRCQLLGNREGNRATVLHFGSIAVAGWEHGIRSEMGAIVMHPDGQLESLPLAAIQLLDAPAIEQEATDNVPRSVPRVEVAGREVWGVDFDEGQGVALKGTTTRLGRIDFQTPIMLASELQAISAARIIAAFHKCEAHPVRFREVI